jgi:hypothetical protein
LSRETETPLLIYNDLQLPTKKETKKINTIEEIKEQFLAKEEEIEPKQIIVNKWTPIGTDVKSNETETATQVEECLVEEIKQEIKPEPTVQAESQLIIEEKVVKLSSSKKTVGFKKRNVDVKNLREKRDDS